MRLSHSLKLYLAAGLLAVVGPHSTTGQTLAPGFDVDNPAGVFTPRDRRLQGLLEQARTELGEERDDYRDPLLTLQQLINEAEDVFTDSTMSVSLRAEASRVIAGLPQKAWRQYEELFDPLAASMLTAAEETAVDRRREVVRRFFHTSTGAETAYLLAAQDMDGGRLLSAARQFDRLRSTHWQAGRFEPELSQRCIVCYWRAGARVRAAEVLEATTVHQPGFAIADRPFPGDGGPGLTVNWLTQTLGEPSASVNAAGSQWTVSRGSTSRNVSVAPVSPLYDDAWRVPLVRDMDTNDPVQVEELATLLDGVVLASREADWPMLPVLSPLVVGETVVFASYGTVKAVDVASGALRWVAVPADQTFVDTMTSTGRTRAGRISADIDDFLTQRAWRDATSAQLSSDGERVYVVRDSGMVGGLPQQFANAAQLTHPRRAKAFNSLRAYDAAGGSWKWEIGGERRRTSLPLAGTFFLGAPLPVDGTLYVLGEDLGQVRLHALAPETGEVRWSLPLANADEDIEEELDRRLAGLSPTAVGGLLICPTGGGLVVAVDPSTRMLVWGRRYREPKSFRTPQQFRRGPFMGLQASRAQQVTMQELMEQPRWHDATIIAAGTSLLVTPPDVAEPEDERRLLCLDLLDGTVIWERPRQDALYVAGVEGETVLLVGRRQVEGVALASGETLWTIPVDTPSGRGVRCGSLYHLPLDTGELATIDIADGTLLTRSPVRSGQPLGNLIAVNGRLISQSATEVCSFRTLSDVEAQLARDLSADPEDPAARSARGELRLHQGDTEAGLNDLRAALTKHRDDRSRQLLVATLLEGLRSDFAGYRKHVDELDRLTAESPLRSRFLMTYAQGLFEAGELSPAFEQYVRLLAGDNGDSSLEYVTDGHTVRRDRRVQGQLARLYEAADESVRTQFERLIQTNLQAAPIDARIRMVRQLAAAIPQLRSSDGEWSAEQSAMAPSTAPTEHEARLLTARRTAADGEQAMIAARLIQLYVRHGRVEPIVQLLDELETAWADSPCLDGQSGAEWAAATRESEDVAALLQQATHWPTGDIAVREGTGNTTPFNPLRTEGPIDPLTADFLFLPDNRSQVVIRDGYGRFIPDGVLKLLPTGSASFQTQYVMQQGHRALLFLGTQFKLIDLINGRPRVLLEDSLVESSPLEASGLRLYQRRVIRQQGFRGQLLWSDEPADNGSVGPLNDSIFCYLHGRTLHAHDPFTGERYWSVEGVPHGAEIFADEDYVLVVPVGEKIATVYRALDGEALGERMLPADVQLRRNGADWGRLFLRISQSESESRLAMYDPVTEQNVWERSLPKPFKWAPRDGRDLCLIDEDGLLTLLDAATGDVLLQQQVDVPDGLLSIYVHSLPDQWLLTTYRRPGADATGQLVQVQDAYPINGPVTAFDRTSGEVMWSRGIPNQMITSGLPPRWPLLSLSAVLQEMPATAGQRRFQALRRHIELIDRQTGKTIHATNTDGNTRRLDNFWHISETPPQLRLRYGMLELEVSFRKTAAETPPEPADEPMPDRTPPSAPSTTETDEK